VNQEPGGEAALLAQVADWLLRLEEAPDDRALRGEYDTWLARSADHRKAHDKVMRLWRNAEALGSGDKSPIETNFGPRSGSARRSRKYAWGVAAIAACLAILALPFVQLRLAADHMTGTAELRQILLEDGSEVALDASSAIAVEYNADRRGVTLLSGQAFFSVVPSSDRPFVVSASDLTVTVTGTSFGVDTSSAGVAVEVATGSVNVAREGRTVADLTVGQRVRIDQGGMAARSVAGPEEIASWRERRLVVHQATIREVVDHIRRYRPGAIVFRDSEVADRLVTGVIDLSRPDEALMAVVEMQRGKVSTLSPYLVVISTR